MALLNEPNFFIQPNSSDDLSSPETYGLDQVDGGYGAGACASSSSPMNSDHHHHQGFVFYPSSDPAVQDHSLIDFNGSFLSFEQNDHHRNFVPAVSTGGGYTALEDNNVDYNYSSWNHQIENIDPRIILENPNYFETSKNHIHGDWLYSDSMVVSTGPLQESVSSKSTGHKRHFTGESTQAPKKQCNGAIAKVAKPKAVASSKDPQSIAAKNRRERISERLKVLQELVPNGTKVDLVTMLEKAISYVKFLQLQVKVLATDEFWPAQGGKAPDISQVKEAIDAILSTQRERNSNSLKPTI